MPWQRCQTPSAGTRPYEAAEVPFPTQRWESIAHRYQGALTALSELGSLGSEACEAFLPHTDHHRAHGRVGPAPDEHLTPPCMEELTAEGEQHHVHVCKHANSSYIKHW